jgi:hypothetical protein
MTIRSAALAVALLAGAAGTALAQATDTIAPQPFPAPWLLSYFPYVGGGAGGGPVLMGRVRYFQPAPWQDRVTYRADVTAEAGVGLHGSWLARVGATAPLLAPGWRGSASAGIVHDTRANFFGLGNATVFDQSRETTDTFAYQMQFEDASARAELARQIVGGVWVVAGGAVAHDRFRALPGLSEFRTAYGDESSDTDVSGKVELVLDTRDVEWDPERGVVAELGVQKGSGGDGYTRYFGVARGYYAIIPGTVVAARVAASDLHGSPPLAARLRIPAWESPIRAYGGSSGNRGLKGNRLAGTGVLMGNLEVRQTITTIQHALTVGVLGFVDGGRVFEGERLRFTTEDLAVSGGGGVFMRLLADNTVTFNVATGPDGVRLSASGGWAF